MSPTALDLRLTPYTATVVRDLEAQVQAEYVVRYGGPDRTEMRAETFEPPQGAFLVGWVGDEPVVCGGFRAGTPAETGPPAQPGPAAEIKRMFVPAAHRGHGYARALLAALEERARESGYRRMILETGAAEPEAIELYTTSEYAPIEGFGYYRDSPHNRCFGKALSGEPPVA
jgi:GNAT superfamily N-acetyltransferase